MNRTKNGILALLLSVPLLCFPARDLFNLLAETDPYKINSMEKFSLFSDTYDNATVEEREIMLSSFSESQISELECLQGVLCEIRTKK